MMKGLHAEEIGGVIHCFSYGIELAREFLNMGFYLGIGGVLTFKNGKKLKTFSRLRFYISHSFFFLPNTWPQRVTYSL